MEGSTSQMNSRIRRVVRTSAIGLVIVIFLVYFLLNTENFKPLLNANYYLLSVAALAYIGGVITNGLFIKFILEPFGKFIAAAEAFYVSVISSIGNFFAPAGTGYGIRAIYLKKKHGLAYSDFISTLSGNYVIVFLVSSSVGLASLLALRQHFSTQWLVLFAVFLGMFAGSLLISLFRFKAPELDTSKNNKINVFKRNIYRAINGWSKIVSNKKLMVKLLILTCVNLALTAFIYWAIIQSIGLSIKLPALLLFSVLGSLSIFVNITPANLGIKEAIYIFSATILGFSVGEMILIALVDRGVQFTVLLVLWLFVTTTRAKAKVLSNDPGA